MRMVERVLWGLVALAVIGLIADIFLKGLFFIMAMALVQLMYFTTSWLILPAPSRRDQHIGITILTSAALSFACTGILFRVQLWPLGPAFLLLGSTLCAASAISAWWHGRAVPGRKGYARNVMVRSLPVGAIALLLLAPSDRALIGFHYRHASPLERELRVRCAETTDADERQALWMRLDSLDQAQHATSME